jgi:hypothetical protein
MSEWLRDLLERIVRAIADWLDRCIPPYEPSVWNDSDGTQFNNNCYNYACNVHTNTFAQPGRATGNMYNQLDCPDVGAGAVSDGLVALDCDRGCGCSECRHQVALVIWPGVDFHWYRKDRDGRWSHKPGSTQARNTDNSGNLIGDPRTADRGPYTVFCGCYCVNKATVQIS